MFPAPDVSANPQRITMEPGPDDTLLTARLDELERRLAALEQAARPVGAQPGAVPGKPSARPAGLPRAASPAPRPAPWESWLSRERWVELGEGLLGRAGVGLIVLGLVFLFRYAVDQGWITPELRIATGLAVGGGLLLAGLLRFHGRVRFRQILMAGGVIVLFVTGLAASELYQLVSGGVSLVFQAAVAAAALVIALRQRDASMATIGTVGALLPPAFLLAGSVPGVALWLYLLIVVTWAATLYVLRGWDSLLVSGAAAACAATFHPVQGTPAHAAAIVVLAAVWLAFAAVPLLRAARAADGGSDPRLLFPLPLLVTAALAVSAAVNLPGAHNFELVAALAAAGFAATALAIVRSGAAAGGLRDIGVPRSAAVFAAVVAGAAAVVVHAQGPSRIVAAAVAAAAAIVVARLTGTLAVVPVAHVLNAWLGLALLSRFDALVARPPFDPWALAFAAATLLAGVASFGIRRAQDRLPYLAGVFGAVHILLATELGRVPGALWLGSVSYAAVGSGLLVLGLQRGNMLLQRAGMLSLALLVLRLFLVDLASVGVGVRIILFLGCGFAFLALSWLFRARRPAT
jgi:uncharacterized membrane protein